MTSKRIVFVILCYLSTCLTACAEEMRSSQPISVADEAVPGLRASSPLQSDALPVLLPSPTPVPAPTQTIAAAVPAAEGESQIEPPQFAVGNELTISALRAREIDGSDIVIEQSLADGANYTQYIASYISEGNRIYGLLTVPFGEIPEGGHPAIVFIHGYIPPAVYRTTERYVAYVDALARAGFVAFKIDLRGFGDSEGKPTGAYFSPDYTVDAISALKSLQKLEYVDPEGIGLWGHSMAGNIVLRALLVEPAVQAGVIWAGAVYSYDDMVRYAIDDPSFRREDQPTTVRAGTTLRETYGPPNTEVPFWQAVSLTENIAYLEAPLQIHHAVDDDVVNIGYSQDLAAVLEEANKAYEFYQYEGGGHNIISPYFSDAMQRTIEFFRTHL